MLKAVAFMGYMGKSFFPRGQNSSIDANTAFSS
jgi:hypothetical protein